MKPLLERFELRDGTTQWSARAEQYPSVDGNLSNDERRGDDRCNAIITYYAAYALKDFIEANQTNPSQNENR